MLKLLLPALGGIRDGYRLPAAAGWTPSPMLTLLGLLTWVFVVLVIARVAGFNDL